MTIGGRSFEAGQLVVLCIGATIRVLVLMMLLTGCTPGAEKVCARRMRVAEDRFGKPDPVTHRKGFVHCVELAEREKRANLPRYKCRADCVLDYKHLEDVGECEARCPQ